jgi:hypothetical protein
MDQSVIAAQWNPYLEAHDKGNDLTISSKKVTMLNAIYEV